MSHLVTSLTSKIFFYTNRVYTNQKVPEKSYVRVKNADNECIYTLGTDPSLSDNQLALSAPQRNQLVVGLGSSVNLAPYSLNKATDLAYELNFDVEPLNRETRITVKEQDLRDFFTTQYANYPFNLGVPFFMDVQDTAFKLTPTLVKAMVQTKDGVDIKRKPFAFFCADTVIRFSVPKTDATKFFHMKEVEKPKEVFNSDWNFEALGIGGLDREASIIFRRAFCSRLLPPETATRLGIKHVKGMLLYGPPGTGKTLIARQIGKILGGREPKIINGPEILNKYVGEAESNIRAQFADAIADYAENKEHADLHVIIFDEIDSICKKRGSVRSGTGVHDTVVNQLLTMIDGVESPNNILVIGMTNRKDLLDPALLRPGRLEVHVEISLPDEPGREQILKIHTKSLNENDSLASDVNLKVLAHKSPNYSGGELEGVVKAATSYAISKCVDTAIGKKLEVDKNFKLQVTQAHFEQALEELKPAFGVDEDELDTLRGTIYNYGGFGEEFKSVKMSVEYNPHPISTLLVQGHRGVGKTAFAAKLALELDYPYAKLIAGYQLLGLGEQEKVARIADLFDEAFKSPKSVLIIDDIEHIIEYTAIGPRFSNTILQALISLLTRPHPHPDRKLVVVLTSSKFAELIELGITSAIQFQIRLRKLTSDDAKFIAREMGVNIESLDPTFITERLAGIGIKRLTTMLAIGKRFSEAEGKPLTTPVFQQALQYTSLPADEEQNQISYLNF